MISVRHGLAMNKLNNWDNVNVTTTGTDNVFHPLVNLKMREIVSDGDCTVESAW